MAYLHELGIVCSLGKNKSEVSASLLAEMPQEHIQYWGKSIDSEADIYCAVAAVEENELPTLSEFHQSYKSRNNQLAMLAFEQIQQMFSNLSATISNNRVAVVVGTSTSGIKEG